MVFLVEILKVHNVRFNANSIFCQGHSIFRFTFFVQSDQKTKNQLSCSDKMRIFYTENKQKVQLFLVTLNEPTKSGYLTAFYDLVNKKCYVNQIL